jgi:hypothetical protein
MCGTSEYSVTELREHHMVCGSSGDYRKVLDWYESLIQCCLLLIKQKASGSKVVEIEFYHFLQNPIPTFSSVY